MRSKLDKRVRLPSFSQTLHLDVYLPYPAHLHGSRTPYPFAASLEYGWNSMCSDPLPMGLQNAANLPCGLSKIPRSHQLNISTSIVLFPGM